MPSSEAETQRVFYQAHPAMFRARPVLYVVFVLLTAAFGLGLILLAVWWIRSRGVTLTITGRLSRLQRGYLSKWTTELRHWDVDEVRVSQSRLHKLMNVGNVSITSGHAKRSGIALRGMPDPMAIKSLIDQARPELHPRR